MYYNVLLGDKHIDLIKANSEEDAIKKIEHMFGPASELSLKH